VGGLADGLSEKEVGLADVVILKLAEDLNHHGEASDGLGNRVSILVCVMML
jgi:hypothetical protein